MDSIRLRILSWKSILGFGKHSFLTVSQIFNFGHNHYLRWVYFNLSKISFSDEILTALHIIGDGNDFRIAKPGVDSVKFDDVKEFLNNQVYNDYHNEDGTLTKKGIIGTAIMKSVRKRKAKARINQINILSQKWRLQRKNQGY